MNQKEKKRATKKEYGECTISYSDLQRTPYDGTWYLYHTLLEKGVPMKKARHRDWWDISPLKSHELEVEWGCVLDWWNDDVYKCYRFNWRKL